MYLFRGKFSKCFSCAVTRGMFKVKLLEGRQMEICTGKLNMPGRRCNQGPTVGRDSGVPIPGESNEVGH